MDFKYGFIYELYNDIDKEVYRGSSITNKNRRFSKHQSDSKNNEKKCKLYIKMRKQGIKHWNIKILSEYMIRSKDTEYLKILEQLYIDQIPKELKLNEIRSHTNRDEYMKNYDNNRSEKRKENIVECICGMKLRYDSLSRHMKREVHFANLKNKNEQ